MFVVSSLPYVRIAIITMFIVIEGIDGAGCETQAQAVIKNLQQQGKTAQYFKFPHYDTPVGAMIKEFLYTHATHSAEEQFLLYTLQFIFDKAQIRKALNNGIVIADRYFTTTLCYQTLEGFPEDVALRYAKDFGIIEPDLTIYLDVQPETAIQWKYGEQKAKNFREKDHAFIRKTYDKYNDLVNRNVWGNWKRVNGNAPIEQVTQSVLSVIRSATK